MSIPVNMLFPVETINRELDFRVMLAERMAKRGHRVYIGKHEALMRVVKHSRGGVFFGKGIIEPYKTEKTEQLEFVRSRDYKFVHLDTEGAVYPGNEDEWRRVLDTRINPRVLGPEEYICTWGDFQRDHYRSKDPECAQNIRTTGHPRFDLLKPAFRQYYGPQAQEIRAKYGDFVLINTNLARANNKLGVPHVFGPGSGYVATNPNTHGPVVDQWFYKTRVFAYFVRLVHEAAAKYPEMTFVVRPHPSEEPSTYQHMFNGVPNVVVTQEGAVSGWLLACRAMIHDGCTTGVEAKLAGCPIINFRPVESITQELRLPNAFGRRAESIEAALEAIGVLTEGEADTLDTPAPDFALGLLENLRSDAFDRVEDVLEEAAALVPYSEAPVYSEIKVVELTHDLVERAKQVVRPFSPYRMKQWKHSRQKFGGLDPRDLASRFARAARVVGAQVRHRLLGDELCMVEPA